MPRLSKRATLISEYESLAYCQVIKDYVCVCFDNADSSEDDIDYCILAELVMLKASRYHVHGSYRQWYSNLKQMLQDGIYITDDESVQLPYG